MFLELHFLLAAFLVPVIAVLYLARVLCGRESRGYVHINDGSELDYRETGGWIGRRVVLFLMVLPALIVLYRVLADVVTPGVGRVKRTTSRGSRCA